MVYVQDADGKDVLAVVSTASGAVAALALSADNALTLGDSLCDACEGLGKLRADHQRRNQ